MQIKLRFVLISLVFVFGIFLFTPNFLFGASKEDTTKYLQATKAIRNGEYQKAKEILENLLNSSEDSDILMKADEKLDLVLKNLKKESLPKIPGVYIQKFSGPPIKLNKEPIARAGLMKVGAKSLLDALEASTSKIEFILNLSSLQVDPEGFSSFIIYNPNLSSAARCDLNFLKRIDPGERRWTDVPSGAQNKTKYVLYSKWSDKFEDGSNFTSDMLLKEKLADGMFKVSFPKNYLPDDTANLALTDGSGYAFPFTFNKTYAKKNIGTKSGPKFMLDDLSGPWIISWDNGTKNKLVIHTVGEKNISGTYINDQKEKCKIVRDEYQQMDISFDIVCNKWTLNMIGRLSENLKECKGNSYYKGKMVGKYLMQKK